MANDGTGGAVDLTEDKDVDIDMEDDDNDVTEGWKLDDADPEDDAECTVPIVILQMVGWGTSLTRNELLLFLLPTTSSYRELLVKLSS